MTITVVVTLKTIENHTMQIVTSRLDCKTSSLVIRMTTSRSKSSLQEMSRTIRTIPHLHMV